MSSKISELTEKTTGEVADEFAINDAGASKKLGMDGIRITQSQITDLATGGFTTVLKTADETITEDTVLNDDSALTFEVEASKHYIVILLFFAVSQSTPDWKYALNVPSGTTAVGVNGTWTAAANPQTPASDHTSAVISLITNATEVAFATFIKIKTDTTAGSVTVQWAQNTSSALATTMK